MPLSAGVQLLLDPNLRSKDLRWRVCLFVGPVIGLATWRLRRHVLESPAGCSSGGRGPFRNLTRSA